MIVFFLQLIFLAFIFLDTKREIYYFLGWIYLDFPFEAALDNKLERSVPFLPSLEEFNALFLWFMRFSVSFTNRSIHLDTNSHFSFS